MNRKNKHTAARERALAVLARMRHRGESLAQAARAKHTTPRTVRNIVGKHLRRGPAGRYRATSFDTFCRDLTVLSLEGYVPVSVRSSKQAQVASAHLIAIVRFIGDGKTEWLKPFVGKRVGGVELLTDPDRLHELADAGLIKLDALYRNNRAGRHNK